MKPVKTKRKHDFMRSVVLLCLTMISLVTLTVIVMAVVRGENIEAGALGVLMGSWCGELLMMLLKRKFETDDKEKEAKEEQDNADLAVHGGNPGGPDCLHPAGSPAGGGHAGGGTEKPMG